ncbi:hypothetical protein [Geodermatophilus sp. URMC 65]|jgi:hypothetical protein
MRSPAPLLRSALAGAVAVVLLTACGGSGDDEPAAAPSTSAPAASSSAPSSGPAPDPAAEGFCGQMTTAFTEVQGSLAAATPQDVAARLPEAVARLEQVQAPADIAGDWTALLDGLRRLSDTAGTLDLGTPEGQQAYADASTQIGQELRPAETALTDYVAANCGLTSASPTS